jgi:hypothetical protein
VRTIEPCSYRRETTLEEMSGLWDASAANREVFDGVIELVR